MAGRCLIVANQTLGGEALGASVRDCIQRDVSRFYIVVPMTRVRHESTAWTGGFAVPEGGSPESLRAAAQASARRQADEARRYGAELDEANRRAQHRLALMIEEIRSMGGEADGEVGTDDPLEAAGAVLADHPAFDEVIISTLPAGASRWIGMDVPHRIARRTDAPVTTIEAQAD